MFKEGTLSSTKMLISLFVEKIIIYEDRVEIKLTFRKKDSQAIQSDSLTSQEIADTIFIPLKSDELNNTYSFIENDLINHIDETKIKSLYVKNTYRHGGGEGQQKENLS